MIRVWTVVFFSGVIAHIESLILLPTDSPPAGISGAVVVRGEAGGCSIGAVAVSEPLTGVELPGCAVEGSPAVLAVKGSVKVGKSEPADTDSSGAAVVTVKVGVVTSGVASRLLRASPWPV